MSGVGIGVGGGGDPNIPPLRLLFAKPGGAGMWYLGSAVWVGRVGGEQCGVLGWGGHTKMRVVC